MDFQFCMNPSNNLIIMTFLFKICCLYNTSCLLTINCLFYANGTVVLFTVQELFKSDVGFLLSDFHYFSIFQPKTVLTVDRYVWLTVFTYFT